MRITCNLCGELKIDISSAIGICASCLRKSSLKDVELLLTNVHTGARAQFPLPLMLPKSDGGVKCKICVAECQISDGEWGWCGLHGNKNGKINHRYSKDNALLSWYLDPQVTNCCNAWFCPAGTGCGHPKWSNKPGPEYGYYNMALFFYGCSFNCLFCQNWQHKEINHAKITSVSEIVQQSLDNKRISCWCWFGGSPEPQISFTFKAQKLLLEEKPNNRIVRFCYEWNGDGNTNLALKAAKFASESGGNIKFDIKAWNPVVHKALTGMDNERVFDNIKNIYDAYWEYRSSESPVLGFSTLLVPYYVGFEEVKEIAKYLAELDKDLPYSLLVFHPDFKMYDLPITSPKQVNKCVEVAKKYLNRVNIANKHLLGLNEINNVNQL